jgi:hypothetical protein
VGLPDFIGPLSNAHNFHNLFSFKREYIMPEPLNPVLWNGNGHYYAFVPGAFTWDEAETDAETLEFQGVSGHLVTITSPQENDFINTTFNTAAPSQFAWIAGVEPNDDGVWIWDSGPEAGTEFSNFATPTPPANFANWGGIEPNDDKPNEDFTMFNIGDTFAGINPGEWADASPIPSSLDPVVGYLVEFEKPPSNPITGYQRGTNQADAFIGTIYVSALPPADISAAAILYADIDALKGDDTIEGIATAVVSSPETTFDFEPSTAIAYGVSQSSIKAGRGEDTLTFSGSSYVSAFGGGTGTGYGLYQASVDTGSGNDTVTISGFGTGRGFLDGIGTGYGVYQASVDTGSGDDTVTISGIGDGGGTGTGYGVYQASVDTGSGNDTVTITGSGQGLGSYKNGGSGNGYGVYQASVDTGSGDDAVTISGLGDGGGGYSGESGTGYGVFQSSVDTGSGNDNLTISGSGSGAGPIAPAFSTGYGVFQSSVDTGSGNDILTISGSGSIIFASGYGEGYGVYQASIDSGSGDDTISINGIGSGTITSIGYGVYQSSVNGGEGDDSISISATATGYEALAYGVYESSVNGGEGDDSFTIMGSAEGSSQSVGYGVAEASIYGESGDDSFVIRGTTFDIKDALISGGDGNDTFDTGIGQGTIDGGTGGKDLIFLNFFDAQTMSIKVLGKNDLQITGTVDGQGNSLSWTQNILNMEQFQVGSNLFTTPVAVADFWT